MRMKDVGTIVFLNELHKRAGDSLYDPEPSYDALFEDAPKHLVQNLYLAIEGIVEFHINQCMQRVLHEDKDTV